MTFIRITHIGGPTTLIEFEGWRLLTDPTFDPPGRTYRFGLGASSQKETGPAVSAEDIGPLDAVLLTHDHHADNLDGAGRQILARARVVLTTAAGARRLGARARGLAAWAVTSLESTAKPTIEVTATPCRHGPPGTGRLVGHVIGFVLRWEGQERGALWISGDTVRHSGLRAIGERYPISVALLHMGGVQFPITGKLRYTMTAKDGVELCRMLRPSNIVPVHYEGWSHFRDGRADIEREFGNADEATRRSLRWAPLGTAIEVPV